MGERKLSKQQATGKCRSFDVASYIIRNYSKMCQRYNILGNKFMYILLADSNVDFSGIKNLTISEILEFVNAYVSRLAVDDTREIAYHTFNGDTIKIICDKCHLNFYTVRNCQYNIINDVAVKLEQASSAKLCQQQGEIRNVS